MHKERTQFESHEASNQKQKKKKREKYLPKKLGEKDFEKSFQDTLVTANIPCLNSIKLPSIPGGITTAITIVSPFAPQGISTTTTLSWVGGAQVYATSG